MEGLIIIVIVVNIYGIIHLDSRLGKIYDDLKDDVEEIKERLEVNDDESLEELF